MKTSLTFKSCLLFAFTLTFFACSGGGGGSNPAPTDLSVSGPTTSGDPAAFRGAGIIQDPKYLIGGPLAQGRVGDILLQNDHIRLVIQKPKRNAGVALYGGNIIDADLTRGVGQAGQDNFGTTFPMINISWTPFYQKLEIINGDFTQGPVIVRATGVLDVYDYIQTSIIVPFAKIASSLHPTLFFPDQYNDVLNPFENIAGLKNISTTVVTDYILRPEKSYIILQTHLMNNGKDPVPIPIGDWVNGSGAIESFVPGDGFTGQGLYSGGLSAGVPALLFSGLETNIGVSYGFFHDPTPFANDDGTFRPTDLLTVSGVSIMGYGEKVAPGLIPISETSAPPKINFSLKSGETTYVRYLAVGNGDISSVLTSGFQALGVQTYTLAGKVVDGQGQAVSGARILVMDSQIHKPVSMLLSNAQGNFSGQLSSGSDSKSKMFGEGKYSLEIYKEGYVDTSAAWTTNTSPSASLAGSFKAGTCNTNAGPTQIVCTLKDSGLVKISAVDENQKPFPARIAIVGFDPSPYHKLPQADVSGFLADTSSPMQDIEFQSQQYGYVDTLFLDPLGSIANTGHPRYVDAHTFRLEPGEYEIFVMRGPEYSQFSKRITVTPGSQTDVQATLKKVVDTTGYISGDFHIHGINSPDSPYGLKARVQFALAEGLDLMVSTDHDVITDYGPTIREMKVQDLVSSIAGDEITPMAFGHFIAFPLQYDPADPVGGAFDYTQKEGYSPGPGHHEVLSPGEALAKIDELNPGEQVLQVNHILDNLLGNFALSRLVTTTKFDGIPALASFADPVQFRLSPNNNSEKNFKPPYPYGTSSLFTDRFTSMELCIGESAVVPLPHVLETSLPTWFNFLNLGKFATATCSSDTHRQIREPVGILRNFVLSSTDPRDGKGTYSSLDPQEIARNVNKHHVIVSAGPFLKAMLTEASTTQVAQVGDLLTLSGSGAKDVNLTIHVESPDWMDWDTVEVYVNTDPIPAKDDLSGPWNKSAEEFVTTQIDPAKNIFHEGPKYLYSPTQSFKRLPNANSLALNQSLIPGKTRGADLNMVLHLTEDSWIVVLVKGSEAAHTLFPYAPKAVNTQQDAVSQAKFLDTLDYERTHEGAPDLIGGGKAFAFTNPIFVDFDGDGFQAKYVREGKSPL